MPTKANETDNAPTKEATMAITILLFLFPPPFLITKALHGHKPWISPHRSLLLLKAPGLVDRKIFPSRRGPSKFLFDMFMLTMLNMLPSNVMTEPLRLLLERFKCSKSKRLSSYGDILPISE